MPSRVCLKRWKFYNIINKLKKNFNPVKNSWENSEIPKFQKSGRDTGYNSQNQEAFPVYRLPTVDVYEMSKSWYLDCLKPNGHIPKSSLFFNACKIGTIDRGKIVSIPYQKPNFLSFLMVCSKLFYIVKNVFIYYL